MKLCEQSISALGQIVTGEAGLTIYRSGPKLVEFFNRFGAEEEYGTGFPSRWYFAESQLQRLNGTSSLSSVIRAALDPRDHLDTDMDLDAAVEHLNKYFRFDGYCVKPDREFYSVSSISSGTIENTSLTGASADTKEFLNEQIAKCHKKLETQDFDGAITNARTFIEASLLDIEREFDSNATDYDGDLIKLYKRVQRLLNLEPGNQNISQPLKQILSGLISICNGLAALRNRMSDAHATSYRPRKHHAKLAVNTAKTLGEFLYDTRSYQKENGLLQQRVEDDVDDSY